MRFKKPVHVSPHMNDSPKNGVRGPESRNRRPEVEIIKKTQDPGDNRSILALFGASKATFGRGLEASKRGSESLRYGAESGPG